MSCINNRLENTGLRIPPDHRELVYSGRVEWRGNRPVFLYPCTSVTIHFRGDRCSVILEAQRQYWNSYLGVIVDGRESKFLIREGKQEVVLAEGLTGGEHTIMMFKPQDGCYQLTIHGFLLPADSTMLEAVKRPKRRIEVYGDSVSAGEVSEAVQYAGRQDPEHNGEYSNSYYSYAWIAARKLQAEIHDIAQGGIALLNGTGYFNEPDYIGMESVYDKTLYNPYFGEVTKWDFAKYTPHVVIIAIGQNDNHPSDYMSEDYDGKKAVYWRTRYQEFVKRIRSLYPKALIILQTTILNHDASWDQAIEQVCREMDDPKIVHFLYEYNGCGTPGHIRIPEAEQMAEELTRFIEGFGDCIWQ